LFDYDECLGLRVLLPELEYHEYQVVVDRVLLHVEAQNRTEIVQVVLHVRGNTLDERLRQLGTAVSYEVRNQPNNVFRGVINVSQNKWDRLDNIAQVDCCIDRAVSQVNQYT
jgi:hypothetical protein